MSAVFVKREPDTNMCSGVCFVCGSNGGEFQLHVKPRDRGSCFPFLENHVPPEGSDLPGSDGSVKSCFLCHSFLNQQWEAFERNKTPHVKRLYWLKRADNGPYMGAEMRFQGEYASQFMGLQSGNQEYENKDRGSVNTYVDDDSTDTILDLRSSRSESMPDMGRAELSSTPNNHLPEVCEEQSVLDLSMPDKNSTTEVCYVCGEECSKGTLINVYAKPIANCPYFPSLMLHPRPSKSRPMDSTGRVQTCTMCHQHLLQQWDAYQRKNMAHSERNYLLRRRQPPVANSTYVCFTCGLEYPLSSHRVLYSCKNHESEPSFPFLEKVQPPSGASMLSSKGAAKVCSVCYKSIHRQRHVYEISKTPEANRMYRIQNEIVMNGSSPEKPKSAYWDNKNEIGCYVCNQIDSVKNMTVLHTIPNKYRSHDVCFPTLKKIPKALYACPMDEDGQILVCRSCYSFLMSQWDAFEAEGVHPDQRRYHVRPAIVNDSPEPYHHLASRKVSSSRSEPIGPDTVLHVQVSTPDLHIDFTTSRSLHSTPRNALLTTVSNSSITPPSSSHSQQLKPSANITASLFANKDKQPIVPEHSVPPAKLIVATNPCENHHHRPPLMVSCVCYVCAQHSEPGQTYSLRCYPQKSSSPNHYEEQHSGGQSAFFPFLTVHASPPAADKMTDDGVVLVCVFCYHSLMAQWTAYETSPSAADRNPWNRIYNHYNYVCYVCGVTTYRKRVRGILVSDYPFLVEHPRPLGSLVLNSGEKVVVCLMCYHSLNAQWNDFERMKVPVELRKYNWIAAPAPPPDDDGRRSRQSVSTNGEAAPTSRGNQIIVIDDDEASYDSQYLNMSASAESPQGLSHGSKPPPLTMLPPSGQKSITRTTATVPPLNQVSPNNSIVTSISNNPALNATRTSSFAAALRKLAKQATEPSPEKDISPVSSPVLSQRSVTPKRAPPPLILPGSQSVSISSPPVVTIAPTQTHLSLPDGRKSSDRGSLGHGGGPLIEPLKRDMGKGHHHLYLDKREEALMSSKDLSSQFAHLRSHQTSTGRPEDMLLASRGFQPYRVTEDIRPSLPPPHMAFDHSPYSYHPMFLPPHMSPSAFRLDDPLYLERYGLIRQPMMSLSSPSMLSHHGVPFLQSGRYPPELLPPPVGLISPSSAALSQERMKYEEEHRHREREREREREIEREREREREREERERERERELEHEREQERERRERERERAREREQRAIERQREMERDKEREKERERREHEALMMRNHDRRMLSPHGINSESPGRHGICNLIPTRDMHVSKSSSQPCSQSTTPSAPPSSGPNLGSFSAAALIAPPTSSLLRAEKEAWIVNHQEHLYPESMNYRHHYFAQQDYHQQDKMDREAKIMDRLWPKEYERHKEKASEPTPPTSHHDKPNAFESNEKTLKRMLDSAPSIGHHREQISASHSHHHMDCSVNHCRDCVQQPPMNMHKPSADQDRTSIALDRATDSSEQHEITVDDETSCGYVTGMDGFRPGSNPPPSLTAIKPPYECDVKKTYAMDFTSHVPVVSASSKETVKSNSQVSQDYVVVSAAGCVSDPSSAPVVDRMQPQVVSKLDVEEQRLRKLRVNGTQLSDCDSEDGDEKLEKKHCKLLTITSGPPLKLDQSPKKLSFLEVVGLTTQQNKKDLEFGKYWNRCQRHHEELKCQLSEEKTVEETGMRLSLENSSRTDELCCACDYPQKTQFLKGLDLESIPKEKQRGKKKQKQHCPKQALFFSVLFCFLFI